MTDALWISRDGTELALISLHNAIRRRTKAEFGKPLPPHWFRDSAVTTFVRDAPASARIPVHPRPGLARDRDQALQSSADDRERRRPRR